MVTIYKRWLQLEVLFSNWIVHVSSLCIGFFPNTLIDIYIFFIMEMLLIS